MSDTKTGPSIVELLTAIKADIGSVGKGERNVQQNFNFRGIDAVVNAASSALIAHHVIVSPLLEKEEYGTVEVGKNRTPMSHCRVQVTYRFYGPAGDYLDARVPGEAMDSGDKATAKAMSVAYRIALLQALSLPTGDVDPDANSYERSDRQRGAEAPADPQTDPAWLEQMEREITVAASMQELQTVANKIQAADQAGQVAFVHGKHLLHLYQQRQGELKGQVAA